ncbi:MAG: CcoQ/FixQ family Cbb3-type cytochrome c oxidase assembly chaperone [Ignavibacteria bacterium]|nr:CcoQ/FixQ family Cbb3-type cytochrome c oxidase assembly chaperone [Ignavibacteria bacterium]
MFEQYLKMTDGVEIYTLFSLLVFFVFFTFILVWFVKADKSYLEKMEKLPLNQNESE